MVVEPPGRQTGCMGVVWLVVVAEAAEFRTRGVAIVVERFVVFAEDRNRGLVEICVTDRFGRRGLSLGRENLVGVFALRSSRCVVRSYFVLGKERLTGVFAFCSSLCAVRSCCKLVEQLESRSATRIEGVFSVLMLLSARRALKA